MEAKYNNLIQYCEHCDKEVSCKIVEKKYEIMNNFENESTILTGRAYCPICHNEIWIGELHDFNLAQRKAA